jgi:chromate transporter
VDGAHDGRVLDRPARRRDLFLVALRLGLTSFGGPIAHIAYFRREYVTRRRWLDEAAFADLVALCQVLPGPTSSQLGIAIGSRRAGPIGALLAWLGFTAPSAIAMILFGLYASSVDLGDAGWVHGLKLAAVAVVAQAVWSMARTLAPDTPRRLLAGVAAAAALMLPSAWAPVVILAIAALVGRLVLPAATTIPAAAADGPPGRRVGIIALGAFAILLVGLQALTAIGGPAVQSFEAFFRAGSLIFGGGHVVLPLLHGSVVEPGWVSEDAFLAGTVPPRRCPDR